MAEEAAKHAIAVRAISLLFQVVFIFMTGILLPVARITFLVPPFQHLPLWLTA